MSRDGPFRTGFRTDRKCAQTRAETGGVSFCTPYRSIGGAETKNPSHGRWPVGPPRSRRCVHCGRSLLPTTSGLYCPLHAGSREPWPPPVQRRLTDAPGLSLAAALLAELRSRGVEPYDAGGVLRRSARTGQLTMALVKQVKAHERELLALLARDEE